MRIHAIGEMIRLAGIRLDSVIVVDADKDDESLGALSVPDEFTSGRTSLGPCGDEIPSGIIATCVSGEFGGGMRFRNRQVIVASHRPSRRWAG